MTRRCLVCTHPHAEQAQVMLDAGHSQRAVQRFLGLKQVDPVYRHFHAGHATKAATLGATPAVPGDRPVVDLAPADPVAHLQQQLADLDAYDLSTMTVNQRMGVMEQRRRVAVELGRIAPPPPVSQLRMVEAAEAMLLAYEDAVEMLPVEHRQAIATYVRERIHAGGFGRQA